MLRVPGGPEGSPTFSIFQMWFRTIRSVRKGPPPAYSVVLLSAEKAIVMENSPLSSEVNETHLREVRSWHVGPGAGLFSYSYVLRFSRSVMGSKFEVVLPAGKYPQAFEAALEALQAVEKLESQLTIFKPDSEISLVNSQAGYCPVSVSADVFRIVDESIRLAEATGGAFDITAGPLWKLWGFARKQRVIPSRTEIESALQRVGYRKIVLDPAARTVFLTEPGMELNLGGIGKGFAVDKAAEILRRHGVKCFLISGGYSSIWAECPSEDQVNGRAFSEESALKQPETDVAQGSGGLPHPMAEGANRWVWEVGIRDPLRPDRRVGILRLNRAAVGTSGSVFQFFRHGDKRLSHIFDPRTGSPLGQRILAITVLAPTATWADALSTAFFVQGPEWAEEFCQREPTVGALFAEACSEPLGYRWLRVGSWPAGVLQLED